MADLIYELENSLNKNLEDNKLGLEILDQTQRKKRDTYNPTIECIEKKLKYLINNYSDIGGFTLTLKKKFHGDDDKWLHNHIEETIRKSRVWKNKEYLLFPEYTKNGVLHYHGIMWDEYQIEIMKCIKWWRRKFGFAKPELELKSKYNWIKYITKNYNKTGLWTIISPKQSRSGDSPS